MNPAMYSSAGVTSSLAEEAFKIYADTLIYNISDIEVKHTTKPFIFRLQWRCALTNEWVTYEQIKLALQEFSLSLFKSQGYVVIVEDPQIDRADA